MPASEDPELCAFVEDVRATWCSVRLIQELLRDETRASILERTANTFILAVLPALHNDIVLGVTRITDPPRQGTNTNFTLETAAQRMEKAASLFDRSEWEDACGQLCRYRKHLLPYRHKRLGHLDAKTLPNVTQLTGLNFDDICDLGNSLEHIVVTIHAHYFNETVDDGNMLGTEMLLTSLNRALLWLEATREGKADYRRDEEV